MAAAAGADVLLVPLVELWAPTTGRELRYGRILGTMILKYFGLWEEKRMETVERRLCNKFENIAIWIKVLPGKYAAHPRA